MIDTREIESIAGTAGETPTGRADVPVSLLAAVADPIRWTVLERMAAGSATPWPEDALDRLRAALPGVVTSKEVPS